MARYLKRFIILSIFAALFYFSFGFFIVQPIGILKDGATILYFRFGLNANFISSADGILLDNDEEVTLLGRVVVLGKYGKAVNERKIASFPYSKALHRLSTNQKPFVR